MPEVDIQSVEGKADLHYETPGGKTLEVDLPSKMQSEPAPNTPAELDPAITGRGEF
jgi:hypothetical protein